MSDQMAAVPAIEAQPSTSVAESIHPTRQATLPFETDVSVTSSQQLAVEAGAVGDVAVVKNEAISLGDHVPDTTITSWLTGLGLSAYIDTFHQRNYVNLYQLEDFSLDDLSKMKIGQAHRNKIWKALLEWRAANNTVDVSQLQPSLSSASDLGLASQSSVSQQSSFCPGYFEITRYTFKQVFSLSKEDSGASPSGCRLRKRQDN